MSSTRQGHPPPRRGGHLNRAGRRRAARSPRCADDGARGWSRDTRECGKDQDIEPDEPRWNREVGARRRCLCSGTTRIPGRKNDRGAGSSETPPAAPLRPAGPTWPGHAGRRSPASLAGGLRGAVARRRLARGLRGAVGLRRRLAGGLRGAVARRLLAGGLRGAVARRRLAGGLRGAVARRLTCWGPAGRRSPASTCAGPAGRRSPASLRGSLRRRHGLGGLSVRRGRQACAQDRSRDKSERVTQIHGCNLLGPGNLSTIG